MRGEDLLRVEAGRHSLICIDVGGGPGFDDGEELRRTAAQAEELLGGVTGEIEQLGGGGEVEVDADDVFEIELGEGGILGAHLLEAFLDAGEVIEIATGDIEGGETYEEGAALFTPGFEGVAVPGAEFGCFDHLLALDGGGVFEVGCVVGRGGLHGGRLTVVDVVDGG